jgi:glycosyltransferase involved in cell wall biosynthesis
MRFVAACRALGLVRARHVFHDHFGRLHTDRSAGPTLTIPLRFGVDFYLGVERRLCTWAIETVGLPPDRVEMVRSGVELRRFVETEAIDLRTELGLPADALVLLMVANFRPQKDHPTLFRAIAELPVEEQDRLHVVICGSTTTDPEYYRSCTAMLDRLGISRCVTAVGVRSDTPALMAGADAGVFSSKNESGPLVILEYMAAGLPFIATDTGEIARAVRGLGAGALVAPRDSLEFAVALSDLIALSPEQRHRIGAVGRRLVADRFEQRHVTQQIEEIYRVVLRTHRRRAGFPIRREAA